MNLEMFVLGCGGMMPLPGRHLTSVLLRREGDLFLFDCGEGTQVSLRRLNLRWKKISAIFISHTHADHVTGLPGMLMLSSQVDRDEPLYIIGPPKIKEVVAAFRDVLDMYINYEIIVQEISTPGVVFETEDFIVRAFFLRHTKPCVGFVLEEHDRPGIFFPDKAIENQVPRGPAWSELQRGNEVQNTDGRTISPEMVLGPRRAGRKVGYITDTLYFPEIAPEVSGSDVLICEGMFTHELAADAAEKRHLTAIQAGSIARDAGGVGKMGLIHYSPRYTERDLTHLLKEAQGVFGDTFLTKDRQTITIPFKD